MKSTIVTCDLCNVQIAKNGLFAFREGVVVIRAKELKFINSLYGNPVAYSSWKRSKYHICPKCVKKIKAFCKENGGAEDA